jgi:hypothetical protein
VGCRWRGLAGGWRWWWVRGFVGRGGGRVVGPRGTRAAAGARGTGWRRDRRVRWGGEGSSGRPDADDSGQSGMWGMGRLGLAVSEPLGEFGRETQAGLAGVTRGPST